MKYADLIERALVEVEGSDASLAALLRGVDALNHDVPSLGELNDAFHAMKKRGRFSHLDWSPVEQVAYEEAIAENWVRITQRLGDEGISSESQQAAVEWHRKLWGKS